MGVLTFLRDVGKHARVNVMLSRDSVKTRLARDEGISFTECASSLILITLPSSVIIRAHSHRGASLQSQSTPLPEVACKDQ